MVPREVFDQFVAQEQKSGVYRTRLIAWTICRAVGMRAPDDKSGRR
jgi:hypothetical protein